MFEGKNLLELAPEARARAGVFLGFQYPIEIPGVANSQFLRLAYNTVQAQRGKDELDPLEFDDFVREKMKLLEMNPDFLDRSVNEGFSGGEKKRNEILQMALLEPRLGILDETDSGLDIDALRVVAGGINQLATKDNAIVLVTHYQRLLNYIVPDYVHVMDGGRIIKTGGKELALELETRGYDWVGAEYDGEGPRNGMNIATGAAISESAGGQPQLPASPIAWLNRLRADAVDRVGALTVPTTRDEEWRFTDISPLTKISFQPARSASPLDAARIDGFALAEADARLTFVDGVYAPQLSFNKAGIVVENLAAGVRKHAAAIEPHLGRHTEFRDNVFAALNTAFLHDGALIVVPRDVSAAAPVHLLFIATQKEAASYPRCLVVAESGSAVTVVEDYVALQDEPYFTNAVSEIALADNASVRHVRVQRENGAAFHIANCAVSLAHASRYQSVSVALGARISRYDLNVLQAAEGAECTIDGLALIGERQLADTHTCIDHARPARARAGSVAQVHRRWRRACGVQRQDHSAPRRAAHRLIAIEPQPALDRQGAHRYQAAIGDLCRRRQVCARRDRRSARRRGSVLPAQPRAVRRRGAQPADLCVRRRDHRPHPGRNAQAPPRADRARCQTNR